MKCPHQVLLLPVLLIDRQNVAEVSAHSAIPLDGMIQ